MIVQVLRLIHGGVIEAASDRLELEHEPRLDLILQKLINQTLLLRILLKNRIRYLNPLTTQQLSKVLLHHGHASVVVVRVP